MKEISEMTDREIQELLLGNIRLANDNLSTIRGWVVFMGIITFLTVIGSIIVAVEILK